MYNVDEFDSVAELEDVPKPEPGGPCPLVLANEHSLVISYLLPASSPFDAGPTERFAFLRFLRPHMHLFGAPNDEVLQGHPLWGRGLGFYGAFMVQNSSLVRRLETMNSVHERHDPKKFKELKHYVITFHDSTFECVANGVTASIENIPSEQQASGMLDHLAAT